MTDSPSLSVLAAVYPLSQEDPWQMAVPQSPHPDREPARPGARGRAGRSSASASLVDQVFNWLATRILSGTYRPGDPLSELAIVEQVGASRTPVREALRRLERDGMVKIIPGRGAFVTDATEREVREIYQCREYLQSLTARLATEHMTPELLERFRAICGQMEEAVANADLPRFFRRNVEFGRLMAECAHNETLNTLAASLGLRVMRLRYLSMGLPTRMEKSLRAHQELIEAFERGDGDAAETIIRVLIHGAAVAILRYHFGLNEQGRPVDLTEQIGDLLADGR